MRISIVSPYFTPFVRGNEFGLAESLAKLGNEVVVIASKSKAPREKTIFNKNYNYLKNLSFGILYLKTYFDLFENPIVGDYNKLLRQIRISDVVMLQEDYPFINHVSYILAKKFNVKTILSSERTYIPRDIMKRLGLSIIDSTIANIVRNGVDVFTVHCSEAKRFLKDVVGLKRDVEVIHVGIDCELFKPINDPLDYLGCGNDDIRILTVARFHKYKGLEYLLMAMKDIVKEVNAKLYLVGKGEEEKRLKELSRKLGIHKYVKFITKPIPNEEMPHVYSLCDIYVQPSIIEPYGIAVLEAMSCGRPVVGTDVGGMKDTIEHGKTGFRSKPANSEDLVRFISILINENRLRKKMSRNARKRAEFFDWIKIGRKYLEVMNK